jgi:hypothetical protein
MRGWNVSASLVFSSGGWLMFFCVSYVGLSVSIYLWVGIVYPNVNGTVFQRGLYSVYICEEFIINIRFLKIRVTWLF